ncbi:uncharacterized protein [Parasteatoda tepidariorum]|uniref:uncharacterized protein n=1 Tax=Parasteatoda tepidariorum TaxID=114398 RepID=UPI00077FC9CB|nr:uncharacterized protein LOC107454438 [Parasteatoda tepidariorum]
MPIFFITFQWFLFWISLIWPSNMVQGNVIQYGMRIKPTKRIVPYIQNSANCLTCNKTSTLKSKSEKENSIPTNNDKTPVNPLVKIQQTNSPIYSAYPRQNSSNGATFFFTQLEPHRFEYRAMFQHRRNDFQPFVHEFQPFSRDYPPLPKLSSLSDFTDFFHNNDPFPKLPDFPNTNEHFPKIADFANKNEHFPKIADFANKNEHFPKIPDYNNNHFPKIPDFINNNEPFAKLPEFTFPTLSPEVKRVWNQVPVLQPPPKPIIEVDNPLIKNYDVVLGQVTYPKIFRFNEERINIEDFDRQKKLRYFNLAKHGDVSDTENVKRDHLLILHGGIFTVKEPPLFNKHFKKRRKLNAFKRHANL